MQRNRIDSELSHIRRSEVVVRCKLAPASKYEAVLGKRRLLPNFSPPHTDVSESIWDELLASMADAPTRQSALRERKERHVYS